MKVPGYIWFDGNKIFKLRFHDELFNLHMVEYRDLCLMRKTRRKERRAAFKRSMRRMELFVLAIWAAVIGFAAVSAF